MGDFLAMDEFQGITREEQKSRISREDKLATIFAQAAVGLSEISFDGRFIQVNGELCRILDRAREELLLLGVTEVTHPDDIQNSLEKSKKSSNPGRPLLSIKDTSA